MFFFNGSLYSVMKVDVYFSKVHVISEGWEQIIPFTVCLRATRTPLHTHFLCLVSSFDLDMLALRKESSH